MFKNFANVWTIIGHASALGNTKPIGLRVAGERIVLFRDSARKPVALLDRCPHRGIALSLGRVKGAKLNARFMDGDLMVRALIAPRRLILMQNGSIYTRIRSLCERTTAYCGSIQGLRPTLSQIFQKHSRSKIHLFVRSRRFGARIGPA